MLFILWARLSYFLKDFSLYLVIIFLSSVICFFLSHKIYKSQHSPKKKKIFLSTVFTALIFVLVFSCFEAYFRYVYDESDGLGFLQVDHKWHERHEVFNNYFFRDRNFENNKSEGTTRIGVLGDSITQGGGIEKNEDRFSNLLEKKLRDVGKNVEVYNLGKSGYDTVGEIREYERVKHLKFDILVWEYFINDIQPLDSTGTPVLRKNSQRDKIVTFLSENSYFIDYIYWRFSARYQKTFTELRTADVEQYNNKQVLENHKKEITNFTKSLKEDKIQIVVIMFPSNFLLGQNYPSYIHQMMGDHFRDQGVIFIDLLPDLKGMDKNKLVASKFDPHPNELVHQLAAEKLYEEIVPHLR